MSLIFGFLSGAIAGGLVEYLLGKILPNNPRPKHMIAVVIAIVVFGIGTVYIFPAQKIASTDPNNCGITVEEIRLEKKVIEIGRETNVAINVINPDGLVTTYDWAATYGDVDPSLGTTSKQTVYKAPNGPLNDTISVSVNTPNCSQMREANITVIPTNTESDSTFVALPTLIVPETELTQLIEKIDKHRTIFS